MGGSLEWEGYDVGPKCPEAQLCESAIPVAKVTRRRECVRIARAWSAIVDRRKGRN